MLWKDVEPSMAIKYVGRYHSEDDPGGLIREVVELGDQFPGPSPDIIFSWILCLPDGQDPAEVAKRVLKDYGLQEGELPDTPAGEVIKLLREVSLYGVERLRRTAQGRPRGTRENRRRRKN